MNEDKLWFEDYWTEEGNCKETDVILSENPEFFSAEFKEWLKQRPQFLRTFVILSADNFDEFCRHGYSALALARTTERELGMVTGESYKYAPELGRLLMAFDSEYYDILWRGERYKHPVKEFISKYGSYVKESFYEEYPEFKGFIVDDATSPIITPTTWSFLSWQGSPKWNRATFVAGRWTP